MAQWYTAAAIGTGVVIGKTMLGIYNGIGSGRIVRIYKVWQLNNQTSGGVAGLGIYQLKKISAGAGGVFVNVQKHDSTNEAIPPQIVISTNMSVTETTSVWKKYVQGLTIPTGVGAVTVSTMGIHPSLYTIFKSETNTDSEPITLREGEGIAIICKDSTIAVTSTICDVFIEFTMGAT